jgi:ABC-2 type transport system ATP-binding protein
LGQPVVEIAELTKIYNGTTVVNKLTLQIEEGEIFGFLGPNGAGKTTTILMLLGLTEPTYGEVRVKGFNSTREPLHVKRMTGYLPENVGFYDDLTARENLRYITRLNRIPDKEATERIGRALESVGLSDVAEKDVSKFSKGMRQRLGIADVLVKEPKLVILDEPTSGIDPAGVNKILDMIVDMSRKRGITVLLSSHMLHQVQKVCDRVGIIVNGSLVAQGTIEGLGKEIIAQGENLLEIQVDELNSRLIDSLGSITGVITVEPSGDMLTIRSDRDVTAEVSRVIVRCGSLPLHMRSKDYALEEIYMNYFQEGCPA